MTPWSCRCVLVRYGILLRLLLTQQLCISCVNAELSTVFLVHVEKECFESYMIAGEASLGSKLGIQRLLEALKTCSSSWSNPVMMVFTDASIVMKNRTKTNREVEIICKMNVEEAPLLKAIHPPIAKYSIRMAMLAEALRKYLKVLGLGNNGRRGEIQIDVHPTHGCLLQGCTRMKCNHLN